MLEETLRCTEPRRRAVRSSLPRVQGGAAPKRQANEDGPPGRDWHMRSRNLSTLTNPRVACPYHPTTTPPTSKFNSQPTFPLNTNQKSQLIR